MEKKSEFEFIDGSEVEVDVESKSADEPIGMSAIDPTTGPLASSKAAGMILEERLRQISEEGWSIEHDDRHLLGDLARAAACYAIADCPSMINGKTERDYIIRSIWPWEAKWFKPGDPVRNLEKAGALILAEIERLLRKGNSDGE